MRQSGLKRGRGTHAARLLAAVVVLLTAGGCGSEEDEGGSVPDPAPAAATSLDLSTSDLWLSFDDDSLDHEGSTAFVDAAEGSSVGRVIVSAGGDAERVLGPRGRGQAVAFPAKCDEQSECARAMVEVSHATELDPGDDDFEYGATVWLAPEETTSGSNIVQKGRFDTEGGQWKLQVDGDDGLPTCVIRGDAPGAVPLVVRSAVPIADSAWHRVVCRRHAFGVSIEVDGNERRKHGETGSVANDAPIRVGAPGVGEEDDQFHGRIDDVYLLMS
jgi:Concanavalin A-like lectin/glucanases superfamily